jgi:predicted metalloprotease with PDZ domain
MKPETRTAPLVYRVRPFDPGARLFEVTCQIEAPAPGGQLLSMPVWIPGSYLLREFARHVVSIRAESAGDPVLLHKIDKHTWQLAAGSGPTLVTMLVYAADPSVRGAALDARGAFFNGVCLFLRVHGQEDVAHLVHIDPPEDPGISPWRLSTSLPRLTGAPGEFGAFRADDYAELIDHPVLMGSLETIEFMAGGVAHAMVLSGAGAVDRKRFADDLARLCSWHIEFFGKPAPISRYVFLVRVGGDGYGGLEHRASAVLACRREDLPPAGAPPNQSAYRRFLGLVSHEYFHAWHVKRIRPAEFVGASLDREHYTRQLWIFEGITSYYDDLALRRSGLITIDQYLEVLSRSITQLYRTAGRRHQTLEEASFDTWIKFYRPDENSPNATVSYYLKGALVALALDLEIRLQSHGSSSLDNVMRALWAEFGADGSPGLPEGQFERLAGAVSGVDLSAFFDQNVRSTFDPPLGILLARFGVRLQLRAAESEGDLGGFRGRREDHPRGWLGLKTHSAEGRLKAAQIVADGPAQRAGVCAGDELVALDGRRIGPDGWEAMVDRLVPGAELALHVFRDQQLLVLRVEPQAAPRDTCYLTLDAEADPESVARRNAWLG